MNKKNTLTGIAVAVLVAAATGAAIWLGGSKGGEEPAKKTFSAKKKTPAKAATAKRSAVRASRIKSFSNAAAKPDIKLADEEYDSLSDEMKKLIDSLQDALDREDRKSVSKLTEQILVTQRKNGVDAVPPYVRAKAVEAISWFLPETLADLIAFMADSDPEVLEDVMDKFSEAIDDPDLGDRELSSILKSVAKVINDEDAIESLLLSVESDMRNSVAVDTYLELWETGTDAVKAKIAESVVDFTGEDEIDSPDKLKEWLKENPDDEDDEEFYAGGDSADSDTDE